LAQKIELTSNKFMLCVRRFSSNLRRLCSFATRVATDMLACFLYAGRWPAELRHVVGFWPPAGGVFDVRKMTIDDRAIFDFFRFFYDSFGMFTAYLANHRQICCIFGRQGPITVKYAAYLAAGNRPAHWACFRQECGNDWSMSVATLSLPFFRPEAVGFFTVDRPSSWGVARGVLFTSVRSSSLGFFTHTDGGAHSSSSSHWCRHPSPKPPAVWQGGGGGVDRGGTAGRGCGGDGDW
jgi:hypothetical protein